MYLYPQSIQDEPLQAQENNQDREQIIENIDKQVVTNQSVELDHEVQKNGDHNDRPFIAMRASAPNYCPGCPYELNPNLSGLTAFGEQVVRSMDESIQNDFKHKVIDIVKVTRTVPLSSNVIQYQILLHVGESDCLKNAVEQPKCSIQLNLPIKTCLVTFEEQPWQQSTRKITKNNCTTHDDTEIKENVNSYSIPNSEALVTPSPQGEETNPEKWETIENLRDILDNYTYVTTKKSEESDQSEVTEHLIQKVSVNRSDDDTTTSVKGFEDKTKEFNEFLKDFDLPTREARSNSEVNREEVKEEIIYPKKVDSTIKQSRDSYRNKREMLTGAPSSKDVNDPQIQELATKGLMKFSENSEGSNEPMIVQIVEASQQVVAGMLYKIRVKLGTSDCPKGTKLNCQLKEGSEIKECLFTIWSQPWIDHGYPKITIDCNLHDRRKRSLRGSQYNQKMLKLAQEIKDETLFENFIKDFNKSYSSAKEKQDRFKIFKQNLRTIEELRTFERGTADYGVTMFADLTPKEFKAHYLGFRPDLKQENDIPSAQAEIPNIPLPPKFDWRDHGVVTPVKNQDEGCNGGYMSNAYKAIERLFHL
ncbi:unnamed protein product [Xylocopa violacea]|uniref:Cysteine proteinase inhibitor n=1 Tax=Xylocopa violacea TaxID=135666 RepID=A0ABP1PF14_XYLVO